MLNPEAGWDDGVFRDHYDAVPDEVIISIQVGWFTFRRDYHAVANARVFVDDRAIDYTIAANADGWQRRTGLLELKIIRAHHDAVPDGRAALNHAAYPHHASL